MDKIVFGTIYTMDRDRPCAEAIGIDGGKITFVGSRAEAATIQAKDVVDYGKDCIMPGFIDTHVHVIPSGVFMNGVDLSKVANLAELKAELKKRVDNTPPGEWIFGTSFQDKYIEEKRFPTRYELDEVSAGHPIWVCHNDTHPYSFNSAALELIKPDPSIDGVETDSDGVLTGFITDPACLSFQGEIIKTFSDELLLDGCKRVDEYAVSHGVTTVFGKDSLRVLKLRNKHKEDFHVEFVPMWMGRGCNDYDGLAELLEDEDLAKSACVCVFADGAFDCYSAAVVEPYKGRPTEFGMLINTDEELYKFAAAARKHDLQFSCHAIGDYGIEQVLRVYERVLREYPKEDHRFRIEHFEMPSKASIAKAAKLGVAMGMQPLLIEICEGMDFSGYACFIGDRAQRCSPYRSVLDAGILIGGGTDFPVTPMNILHGARICMENPNPNERISLMECLEMNTVNAAKLGFMENRKGSIKPGLDADIIVLSKNPFEVTTEELSDISIKATFCRGDIVYSAD